MVDLDGDIVRWLGFSLYVSGGALRIAPVFVLGRRFSGLVAIQPGHELVTDGIYGRVRHPSYLGLIIMGLGWALTFRSGVGVVLAGLVIPPLLARIRSEETLLRSQFGEEYDSYRRRTARLIPGIYSAALRAVVRKYHPPPARSDDCSEKLLQESLHQLSSVREGSGESRAEYAPHLVCP